MQTAEEVMEIRVMLKQGKSIREVARELGVSRNTVRRYARGAEPGYKARPPVAGKLAPHAEWLAERVRRAAPERLSATALLAELRHRGYRGSITILREHLAALRPAPEPEALIRFETAPGDQMQVDWAVVRRGPERLSAFIAVLGYSRAAYVEFVSDEKLEMLIACHQEAFVYFGGVPRTVLPDYVPLGDMWRGFWKSLDCNEGLFIEGNIISRSPGSATFAGSIRNGGCHAGAVLCPSRYGRPHSGVLDRRADRTIRRLARRAGVCRAQCASAGADPGPVRRLCGEPRRNPLGRAAGHRQVRAGRDARVTV